MELKNFASINQTQRNPYTTSHAYRFIPTTKVLGILADHGWHPVRAREAGVKKPEYRGFQKHVIDLENPELGRALNVGDVIPRIVLTNSHKGDAAFELFAGLLELVCMNGLVVKKEGWLTHRIPHIRFATWNVEYAVRDIVHHIPEVLETRDRWRSIRLEPAQMLDMAQQAIPLRFDGDRYVVEPHELLHFRPGQADGSLWSVFNAIQEGLIRGGLLYRRRDGTTAKSRPLNAIEESIRINGDLWALAEQTAESLN